MTPHKVTTGELLAGLSGALLIGVLFAPWHDGAAGFGAVAPIAALLALTGAAAVALLATTAWQATQAVPVAIAASCALLAAAMTVVVLVHDVVADGIRWGAWAALAAVAGVLSGCWRALRMPERRS